jgi:hypothetical protein
MRMIAFLATAILLPFASAVAAANQQRAVEECEALSQSDMRECLTRKAAERQALLKRAESDAAAALGQWDEDEKHGKRAKRQLDLANQAFARYRDAQCGFVAALGGGAIAHAVAMRRLACTIELNEGRAASLADSVSDLPRR